MAENGPEGPPRVGCARRLAMWLGGALLLLALLVFLGRDLPRQLVERQIGATLGGETHLEALEWPGEGIFLLKGLEVASPSFSAALRRLEIDEIEVAATWEQLRRGQVGSLTLRGLRAELDPSRPLLAAGEGPEAPFHSLAVASGAQVLVVSRAGQALASATFTASFTNAPGFPGEITATITGLDLSDFETLMPLELPEPLRRQLAGLELGEIELKGSSGEGGFELEAKAKPWRQAAFHLRGSSLSGRLEGLELAALAPTSALLAASGQLDLSLSGSLAAAELELALSPARFRFGQDAFELGPTRLRGRYHREQAAHHLTVTSFASELLAASMLPAEAGPALPLDLKFAGELDLTAQQATIKGQIESQALGVFPFAGEVAASEGLDLAVTTPQLRISQLLELLPTKPGLPKAAEVAGSAAAKLEIRGPLAAPRVRAELELAGLAPAPGLTDLAGTASLIWSAQAAALVGCQRFSARAKVAPPLAGMAIVELDVRGAGQIDIDRRRLLLRDLELRTAKLGQLAGEIEAEFPAEADLADASVKARFEIREVALENWLAEAQNTGLPAGMSFSGKFTALPALQKASGGPWELTGSWKLEGAGFASAAGDRVLEGLTLTGDLAASLAAAATPGAAYTLTTHGQSSGFLLLWGTLFGDFSSARIGLLGRAEGRLGDAPSFGLELAPSPGLTVTAALAEQSSYRLAVTATDLEAVRRDWLLPLFAGMAPLELAGRLELHAAGSLPAAAGAPYSASGELQLRGGQLQKGTLAAEGLELDLPFDLRQQGGSFSGPRLQGRLAAHRLAAGGLEVPPLASRLWVEADAIGLEQALEVAMAGGRIRLEKVVAGNLLAENPRLETAIGFDGLSLAELSAGAGFLPLEGRLDGSLPRVVVQGEKLEVEGGGKIALFGGEIEIGDISGRDVFSPYPRLRLSARFHDLDLGKITRRFDFGEMQGILAGEIESCELFRNVPLAFKARVVSVERKGVRQTVDVKAVQNLTILGTGASTNILDRGIQRFFKRYNYAQLGISAQLGNDVLLLRGLEHRGEKELFLRGRPPFSIDIVNAQPGKTVSFLAMVRRLKSLDVGKARTSP